MKATRRLAQLETVWLDTQKTAQLMTDMLEDLFDSTNALDCDPQDPKWSGAALRVVSRTKDTRALLNRRLEEFTDSIVRYYRQYITEAGEHAGPHIFDDAMYIIRKVTGRAPPERDGHPRNMATVMEMLRSFELSEIEEIEILGEIHRTLTDDREAPEDLEALEEPPEAREPCGLCNAIYGPPGKCVEISRFNEERGWHHPGCVKLQG